MATTLDRAVEPDEIVVALRPFGVSQRDVAAATQVSDRAVRAWKTGGIHDESYDRLQYLRDIVLVLADSLTARGVANGSTLAIDFSTARARSICSRRVESTKSAKPRTAS